MIRFPTYESCTLCPRMCRIDRSRKTGYCGCTDQLKAARAALHKWEEPCLSGPEWARGGSGTVFFSELFATDGIILGQRVQDS